MVPSANGSFWVVYPNAAKAVFARRVDRRGALVGGPIAVFPAAMSLIAVQAAGSGDGGLIAWQHVYDTPVPVRQVRPELSPATEAVVLRSLAKDPAHRFQTAAEMGAALKQASSCPTSSWRANGGGANVSRQIGSSVGDASARWVWPLVLVASALGALAATVANWPSPIRPVLVLWFLLVCPGMALVRLLWLEDAIAEWTLAVAVSLALEIIIAGTMLYAGLWVPPLILATLAAVSLAGALVQLWRSANQRGPVDAAARRVATERESWWSCQDLHRLLVAALARLGGG